MGGVDLGTYNESWNKLFKTRLGDFKTLKNFLLLPNGDTLSILGSLKNKIKILFQRCLSHIPYQLRFVLLKDKK